MEKITETDIKYSKISARLGNLGQALHQVSQTPKSMKKSSDIKWFGNRSILVRLIPDPFLRTGDREMS